MIHPWPWGRSLLSGRGRALGHPLSVLRGHWLGTVEGVGVAIGRTSGGPHNSLLVMNPDIFRLFSEALMRFSISGYKCVKYYMLYIIFYACCLALCLVSMQLKKVCSNTHQFCKVWVILILQSIPASLVSPHTMMCIWHSGLFTALGGEL